MVISSLVSSTAQPISEQAAVTEWPMRIFLTLATLAVIALCLYGLRVGWRRRARRQDWAGDLPEPLATAGDDALQGKYLGTVTAGDWTDRVVAAGGMARSWTEVTAVGVAVQRQGEPDLFIPAEALRSVDTAPGFLQKVFGRHGVLCLTWQWQDRDVTTGIWYPSADDQRAVREACDALLAEPSRGANLPQNGGQNSEFPGFNPRFGVGGA